MNEFFASLGADLRDRRFLPILVVLGVVLIAAVAWAALGGKSSTGTPPAAVTATGGASAEAGMAITKAPTTAPKQAIAETTGGAPHPKGAPRNPFKPLPGAKKESSSSSSGNTVTISKSTSSSGGTTPESSGTSSSESSSPKTSSSKTSSPTESTTTATPKYYIHYHVTVRFGLAPKEEAAPEGEAAEEEGATAEENAAAQPTQLKLYKNVSVDAALPGKKNAQLVYLGVVVKTGDTAVFALTGKTKLHGPAHCKPSRKKCAGIELKAGQTEMLGVTGPTGETVIYKLKVVSIKKSVNTNPPAAGTSSKIAAKA